MGALLRRTLLSGSRFFRCFKFLIFFDIFKNGPKLFKMMYFDLLSSNFLLKTSISLDLDLKTELINWGVCRVYLALFKPVWVK